MILFFLVLSSFAFAQQKVSIMDIQYTEISGVDATYPSLLKGKSIITEGIVTGFDKESNQFFITEPEGGAWKSIAVISKKSSAKTNISVGDRIEVSGIVIEKFGFTAINSHSQIRIINSGNKLPNACNITTYEVSSDEAYESVLVKVNNVQLLYSGTRRSKITDGSGKCFLRLTNVNSYFNNQMSDSEWNEISGIIVYEYGSYKLTPLNQEDFVKTSSVGIHPASWGKIKSYYK